MKKIILINASQRKNKNSEQLTNHISTKIKEISMQKYAVETGVQIKYLDLKTMDFKGCIDCGYCQKHKGCSIGDDIQNIYKDFDESDATVIVTPIYFDGTPWKLKAFIDRMQAIYNSKYVLGDSLIDRAKKRQGFVVSVAGAPQYETQFTGNNYVMEFLFKSINTRFLEHIKIADTDEKMAMQNHEAIIKIDELISKII